MDGMCMRIGRQSIKEPSIVFGNRKATTYTQHSLVNSSGLTAPKFSRPSCSIARAKISSFDITTYLLSVAVVCSDPAFRSILFSSLLFFIPFRALHFVLRPNALNFLQINKQKAIFFSLLVFR